MEEKLAKLAVSPDADKALDRMLARVNSGYTAGRLKKPQLLSWLIANFEKQTFESAIDDIRKAFFDEMAYLEFVVRELKKSKRLGEKTPEVASLLSPIVSRIRDNQPAERERPESLRSPSPSTSRGKE
jgi:hypothetical protein